MPRRGGGEGVHLRAEVFQFLHAGQATARDGLQGNDKALVIHVGHGLHFLPQAVHGAAGDEKAVAAGKARQGAEFLRLAQGDVGHVVEARLEPRQILFDHVVQIHQQAFAAGGFFLLPRRRGHGGEGEFAALGFRLFQEDDFVFLHFHIEAVAAEFLHHQHADGLDRRGFRFFRRPLRTGEQVGGAGGGVFFGGVFRHVGLAHHHQRFALSAFFVLPASQARAAAPVAHRIGLPFEQRVFVGMAELLAHFAAVFVFLIHVVGGYAQNHQQAQRRRHPDFSVHSGLSVACRIKNGGDYNGNRRPYQPLLLYGHKRRS